MTTEANCRSPRRRGDDLQRARTLGRPAGEDMPVASLTRLQTVSVTLADAVGDRDEMLTTLREHLAHFQLLVGNDRGRTVLILTIETRDLWLAVLTAMNAVTATGYAPVAVTAEPAWFRLGSHAVGTLGAWRATDAQRAPLPEAEA